MQMDFYYPHMGELFQSLEIVKIIADRQGKQEAQKLFPINAEDYVYEIYVSALNSIPELVWFEYYDHDGVNIYRFVQQEMTDYFRLAHKYGEMLKLPKEHNRYIQTAFQHLGQTVGSIPSYCFGCRLYATQIRPSRLYFLHDQDYWMPVDTIYQLYEFFDFFPEKLPALQKEVKKLVSSKKSKGKRRVAA